MYITGQSLHWWDQWPYKNRPQRGALLFPPCEVLVKTAIYETGNRPSPKSGVLVLHLPVTTTVRDTTTSRLFCNSDPSGLRHTASESFHNVTPFPFQGSSLAPSLNASFLLVTSNFFQFLVGPGFFSVKLYMWLPLLGMFFPQSVYTRVT